MKRIQIFLIALSCCTWIAACNNGADGYDIKDDDSYKSKTQELKNVEKSDPKQFLSVKASDKKNLLGQTVVKGVIYNSAKIAGYQDIEVKLKFYSKTKALLEEDVETVYEHISAGGSTKFKSKYFTPKGTDSLFIEVLGAKVIE